MDLKKILEKVTNFEEYKLAKSNFFSKNPELNELRLKLKQASGNEKAELGKLIHEITKTAQVEFEKKLIQLERNAIDSKLKSEYIDVTRTFEPQGGLTPITKVIERLRTWLLQNGYQEEFVSEIETDEINFQKLNIPQNHPARDMQDSLYINENTLLRTHNTGGTVRAMLKNAPKPIASFTIGNVFRKDDEDETHSHQFVQCDILFLGQVSLPNLIWTLKSLLSFIFEQDLEIRLRPSFFPFTEPSCEVDIFYKDRWIEILGAGMLHPNVLKMCNYDPSKIRAFAAGIGIERLAMIKYDIKDIREFYKNDLRFAKQFKGFW